MSEITEPGLTTDRVIKTIIEWLRSDERPEMSDQIVLFLGILVGTAERLEYENERMRTVFREIHLIAFANRREAAVLPAIEELSKQFLPDSDEEREKMEAAKRSILG